MCKTRFDSQGMILDVFKKNIFEKSFMARGAPPPFMWQMHLKNSLFFWRLFQQAWLESNFRVSTRDQLIMFRLIIQVSTLVLINRSTLDFRKNYNHSGKTISLPRQPLRRWAWSRIISSWEDALQCFVLFSDVFNLQESDGNRGAWEEVWRYMRKVNCARL